MVKDEPRESATAAFVTSRNVREMRRSPGCQHQSEHRNPGLQAEGIWFAVSDEIPQKVPALGELRDGHHQLVANRRGRSR